MGLQQVLVASSRCRSCRSSRAGQQVGAAALVQGGREQCMLQTGAGCGWCGFTGVQRRDHAAGRGASESAVPMRKLACTAQQHQRAREMSGHGAAAAAAAAATWTVFWGAGSTLLGRVLYLHGVIDPAGATFGLRQWHWFGADAACTCRPAAGLADWPH